MDDDEADLREQIFHNNVREQIIFLLLFILLYLFSFVLIEKFRRRDGEDYFMGDEDEVKVYRISLWLCTFALAVSLGSALLLPVSIVSNEVLILYPNSYYVKWLNSSLIQGLWNHVFLFSNLSLFVFLPFAYLFSESSGFPGCRGLRGRVYETFTVLALLGVAMLGLAYVISAWLEGDRSSIDALLSLWTYLPFLYSCVSFVGVLMLLVFTPLGFVRLFGVVGGVLVKPQFLRDLDEEYYVYSAEEDTLRRRLRNATSTGIGYISPEPMYPDRGDISAPLDMDVSKSPGVGKLAPPLLRLRNGALQAGLNERLRSVVGRRKEVESQRKTSSLQRNVVYPIAMLALLALTTLTVLLVLHNTLGLLTGAKSPLNTRQFTLGLTSLSKLGWAGATLEAFLILYLQCASLTGVGTTARALHVLPGAGRTPLRRLIAAEAVLLLHCTAQPLLVKILGITNFDLLGEFGRIEWLGNFRLVLLYNAIFAATVTLCLVSKFTASVRRELYNRFKWIGELFNPEPVPLVAASLTPRPSADRTATLADSNFDLTESPKEKPD
ncbi:protein Lilipod isoform X2 [Plutella xylostella]|uniref:protein Lilipod isoform X1 n=1 Tax=Plutella xylostella TaxID=51655 RepID=UPI0020324699|nr:protein Lilipod isoform X1 [Plutella xylostella]XP_048479209.1 protein Lilipod isoform X2 [Plutella xylostella]